MYSIGNHNLESISGDDNGAYGTKMELSGTKKAFYVNINGTNVSSKIVHLKNEKHVYKEKEGRRYVDIVVNEKDIFDIERYYRINKRISQLKRTICRINNICKPVYEPYFCVVYSLNDDLTT